MTSRLHSGHTLEAGMLQVGYGDLQERKRKLAEQIEVTCLQLKCINNHAYS